MDIADYLVNDKITFNCGLAVSPADILAAVVSANNELHDLPALLWSRIDLKSTGAIIGAHLVAAIAEKIGAIVNPIEKGHPDILPPEAKGSSEADLRNYPTGIEIKGTCGNLPRGSKSGAGVARVSSLTGITWQAHHQEVSKLLATVWDFCEVSGGIMSPTITAAFYSESLVTGDWGAVSGTTGRNTKVSGMLSSGKKKMARGAILALKDGNYRKKYESILGIYRHLGHTAWLSETLS